MAVVGVGSWRVTFRLGSRGQCGQAGFPPPSGVVSWCHQSLHVGEPLGIAAISARAALASRTSARRRTA
eukprot:4446137-Alexandrium_andersonii.AAC.1